MAEAERRDPNAGFAGRIGRTTAESQSWWPPRRRAREGAPNVVVVLADDLGYSDIGPFGSEIATPALDRLAETGVRLANYHTTPLCSPTRAALLTGLNPHRAGYATVANADPGFPNYRMEIDEDVPTLPEAFREAGYATLMVGKWHLVRDSAINPAGSRANWPIQRGFDRFYGFLEGLTNVHHPHQLVLDNTPLDIDDYPDGYFLPDDLDEKAAAMITSLRAHDATQPFFLYYAHPAVHAPLLAPREDIAAEQGRYDGGWDAVREERFARQLAAGLFDPGTVLPERNGEEGLDVPDWEELSDEQRALCARYMEVYAAMVRSIDRSVARLVATLEAIGELDNTIILFTSDNGADGEGGAEGTRSYFKQFILGIPRPPDWGPDVPLDPDLAGGPRGLVHYPRGWAMTSNTPFRLYKAQTYAGGVRAPLIVSWPRGLAPAADDDRPRHQYQYVTDLLPTLLDLAGVERPQRRRGHDVQPVDGVSFAEVLASPDAPSRHVEQYSEITGNRSFYRDGWKLVTLHAPGTPYDDAEWRLYDVASDPTETRDRAAEHPEKVAELAQAWEDAARANGVFPLDDGTGYTMRTRPAHHRELSEPLRLLPGTPTLERFRSQQLVLFRSFDVDVAVEHGDGAEGVLVAHGGQGGGYALYVEDGRLRLAYNEYGRLLELDGGPLAPGDRQIRLRAEAVGDLRWDLALEVDDEVVGKLPGVQMLIGMAPLEGISVGRDARSPVSWALHRRHGSFAYDGRLREVWYSPGPPAPIGPGLAAAAQAEAERAFE